MTGGKSKVQKVISKRLQETFENIKEVIFYKKINNIRSCCDNCEDFSSSKFDFEIKKYLENQMCYTIYYFVYLRDTLNYLFTNEVSRDMYKNQKDFNLNEFKLKLIKLNKNIDLTFEVEAIIKFNEKGEMLYKEFIFSEINCNENFVEIFSETIKKIERIEDSFEKITGEYNSQYQTLKEKITGEYNSQYQTLKEKMFEEVDKLFEEENI
jgi:hypothetical protein